MAKSKTTLTSALTLVPSTGVRFFYRRIWKTKMTSIYGGQMQGITISAWTKIMRFFVTLSFLTLEIIRYGCELTLAQLPITAEMTGSTGIGRNTKGQQERYKSKQPSFEEKPIFKKKASSIGPASKQKD